MQITRRELAAALTSGAALAQTAPINPATSDEALKAAQERLRANSRRLAQDEVPMSTEPAFQFKA
ncbi:MAG TPA: hypothetical protein VG675_21960 [Bryobacteraceae bacterium]|nr:hypothetical protein [Bryobacteraceae bacterium]